MLTTIEKVLALKQFSLFKNVSNVALSDLMALSEEQTLSKGEKLIEQDKVNKHVYFILSGSVESVSAKTQTLFPDQQIIGLDSVFCQEPASETICIKQQVSMLKVERDKLYRMMALHPSLAMAILNELSLLIIRQKKD